MSRFVKDYLAKAQELSANGTTFVTATLVKPEGHVPQDAGAKAIITQAGLAWGTVGGGRLEARVVEHALALLARAGSGQGPASIAPELIRYDLKRDLDMVCGGAATFFYELAASRTWNIAVFGAGHVAQALVPLLCTFECTLHCIDPRPEWLARLPDHPRLTKLHAECPADAAPSLPTDTFFAVMSQGHATDLPIVRRILARGDFAFLGVIGSKPKARTLRAALLEEGFAESFLDRIQCPIGLTLGTNAPAEIAVSIGAQLLQARDALAGHVPHAEAPL